MRVFEDYVMALVQAVEDAVEAAEQLKPSRDTRRPRRTSVVQYSQHRPKKIVGSDFVPRPPAHGPSSGSRGRYRS
jgi:hypothetical protein